MAQAPNRVGRAQQRAEKLLRGSPGPRLGPGSTTEICQDAPVRTVSVQVAARAVLGGQKRDIQGSAVGLATLLDGSLGLSRF